MMGPLGDVMMSSPELTAAGLSALVFAGVVGTATEKGVKGLLVAVSLSSTRELVLSLVVMMRLMNSVRKKKEMRTVVGSQD
ncbi:hypothetical protein [Halogeometricum borinquense]|uniref:hypothetical protein n=1 Tax=Halogeometricum borinquense TaxID=60847 RepID=UPI003436FA62